ncbi:MAG: glutathione S-transferase N-terminal domain-containing protein [Rhizobiaceae bacterium]|nr:glutathione S-transferase N-terminal domain-containing protein [Rhizobiaceae bacterium]
MNTDLKIIGRASSINVRKVLWTCREVDLPFEFDSEWDGDRRDARREELRRLNLNDQFPVLIDGDSMLWESNTICRYLAARSGRYDLLPAEPRERASVEQWMDWQATDLNASWRYAFMGIVRKAPQFQQIEEIFRSVAAWNDKIEILDRQLEKTGAFVAGSQFTLADIVIGLSVNRWFLTPIARPDFRFVAAYFERLQDRPGFADYVANGVP